MHLEWRRVTWYSRALALVLFIALPFGGFALGFWYARSIGPLAVVVNKPTTPAKGTIVLDGMFASSTTNAGDPDIAARDVATIRLAQPYAFTLPTYPEVSFRIMGISRARGGQAVATCGEGSDYIFLKHAHIFSPPGTCYHTKDPGLSGTGGLIVIDFVIENKSDRFIDGRFLQLFYNATRDGQVASIPAAAVPNWESYGSRPYAEKRYLVGFAVPDTTNEAQLIYGDYGKLTGGPKTNEEFYGRTVNGFLIDFVSARISEIPG